jgi:hypothetical protein
MPNKFHDSTNNHIMKCEICIHSHVY